MSTILYITAHPGNPEASYSLSVGEQFVQAYQESHPEDKIVHVDLYQRDIPHIDADVLEAWGKLQTGASFDQLTAAHQEKITQLNHLLEEFVTADKYVFVTPMWNFSYPPVLKAYIDSFCVRAKTFKYTENGPVGLLHNKKAFHIQASGGIYSEGPVAERENGSRHLKTVLNFVGVTDFDSLFVEGLSTAGDRAPQIKAEAIEKARNAAKNF
ncbi:FMN-dependent NADH-azoreductase [Paenibacillus sp. FSL M8-0228]|jgi:FMN-dependent NADH-azoreductase|uniref:FMN-dependent NADH-azoreductase n=1 Tax=Paenibacillus TaxID=44249 RepID=UPI00041C3F1B|nr:MULTISPECIES: FMN-dependent NADH-azoreductase [Paenibacillus]MBO3287162.1 FMN-dependent NADH-azoreductase [Paenibacillus polymyxa]MBP1312434.1 FMN-dependent NADH-azoreductase [Paenibacillus sp. 1182]ODB55501.1 FMN-dependent NADH-azoreductase [Paenibacillus polymyxa]UMY57179.1 FMN-dependent NADH-azoreductase [Paenibacillus peoriae]